jgi:hypothetical protein
MNIFIFLPIQSINQSIFLYFKSPLWIVGVFLLKNNYIGIFIIKLLMYNQFQILNLISFIIRYRCPKKGHFSKMGIVIQKVNHLNVHSPIHTWLSQKLLLRNLGHVIKKWDKFISILYHLYYVQPFCQITWMLLHKFEHRSLQKEPHKPLHNHDSSF